MKKFMTAAAIVALMTLPALAEGDDASTKAGDPNSTVKATTDMKQDAGSSAMGQGALIRRPPATTGAATINELNKTENSSTNNPGQKTDVSGGSGGSSGGGSGGSGGGNQ